MKTGVKNQKGKKVNEKQLYIKNDVEIRLIDDDCCVSKDKKKMKKAMEKFNVCVCALKSN